VPRNSALRTTRTATEWLELVGQRVIASMRELKISRVIRVEPLTAGSRGGSLVFGLGELRQDESALALWLDPIQGSAEREMSYWFVAATGATARRIAKAGASMFGEPTLFRAGIDGPYTALKDRAVLDLRAKGHPSFYGVWSDFVPRFDELPPRRFVHDIARFFALTARAAAGVFEATSTSAVQPVIRRIPCPGCRTRIPSYAVECERCDWGSRRRISGGSEEQRYPVELPDT
jgi:hypothetical protein